MANITASANWEISPSQTKVVDEYLQKLNHPMKHVAVLLRQIFLGSHKNIGEEIAWNAPAFYFTGKMKPFAPKEYKRFIVGMNFFKKDCLRVIFLKGSLANDNTGMLEGSYADGRRLAYFKNAEEVNAKKNDLQKIMKQLVKQLEID